ncbi:MAG TPA: diguanylate cyclase [Noviherbaspirillum sp.]|nr:diguanylate cyclase [Noviherbaspirillum sp.]
MGIARRVVERFAGDDIKMRRLVTYWGATVLLYLLSLVILWVEVSDGTAPAAPVIVLTVLATAGHVFFYVLIRHGKDLALTPAQLSVYQGRFAVICTIAGYAVMGPLRGASLVILTVILVFCAFTLEARKTHSLGIFAISLLGLTMFSMRMAAPHVFDAKAELIHFSISASTLFVVASLTGRLSELRATLSAQKQELADALAHIQTLATRDELTMLPNRRHMGDLLQQEERRRSSDHTTACLAIIDIDWFKKINDGYGHAAGDEVLRRFAEESRQNLRDNDVLARWGGEEFLLYFPRTPLDAAGAVLQRLRQHIASLQFHSGDVQFRVTFSAGLIELLPGESIDVGFRRADQLLYQAKADGRNRVVSEVDASRSEALAGEPS